MSLIDNVREANKLVESLDALNSIRFIVDTSDQKRPRLLIVGDPVVMDNMDEATALATALNQAISGVYNTSAVQVETKIETNLARKDAAIDAVPPAQ